MAVKINNRLSGSVITRKIGRSSCSRAVTGCPMVAKHTVLIVSADLAPSAEEPHHPSLGDSSNANG
jgi:hypothetical protein